MTQSIEEAMREACDAIGIRVPKKLMPGIWAKSPVVGKAASNTSGRVLIFDDWKGGIAHNWATGQQQKFRIDGTNEPIRRARPKADPERARRRQEEQREIERICTELVYGCQQEPHPYLERKGFPDEACLVHEAPHKHFPATRLGEAMAKAMPETEGPFLIVPGRIGQRIMTVQFIAPDGTKKNILRGQMGGASHRIATGARRGCVRGSQRL